MTLLLAVALALLLADRLGAFRAAHREDEAHAFERELLAMGEEVCWEEWAAQRPGRGPVMRMR